MPLLDAMNMSPDDKQSLQYVAGLIIVLVVLLLICKSRKGNSMEGAKNGNYSGYMASGHEYGTFAPNDWMTTRREGAGEDLSSLAKVPYSLFPQLQFAPGSGIMPGKEQGVMSGMSPKPAYLKSSKLEGINALDNGRGKNLSMWDQDQGPQASRLENQHILTGGRSLRSMVDGSVPIDVYERKASAKDHAKANLNIKDGMETPLKPNDALYFAGSDCGHSIDILAKTDYQPQYGCLSTNLVSI